MVERNQEAVEDMCLYKHPFIYIQYNITYYKVPNYRRPLEN